MNQFLIILGFVISWTFLVESYVHAQEAEETPQERQQLIQRYEKDPKNFQDQDLLSVAVAYATEKRLDEAEPLYQKVLSVQPDNGRACRGLGLIYSIRDKEEEAVRFYQKGWASDEGGQSKIFPGITGFL